MAQTAAEKKAAKAAEAAANGGPPVEPPYPLGLFVGFGCHATYMGGVDYAIDPETGCITGLL